MRTREKRRTCRASTSPRAAVRSDHVQRAPTQSGRLIDPGQKFSDRFDIRFVCPIGFGWARNPGRLAGFTERTKLATLNNLQLSAHRYHSSRLRRNAGIMPYWNWTCCRVTSMSCPGASRTNSGQSAQTMCTRDCGAVCRTRWQSYDRAAERLGCGDGKGPDRGAWRIIRKTRPLRGNSLTSSPTSRAISRAVTVQAWPWRAHARPRESPPGAGPRIPPYPFSHLAISVSLVT